MARFHMQVRANQPSHTLTSSPCRSSRCGCGNVQAANSIGPIVRHDDGYRTRDGQQAAVQCRWGLCKWKLQVLQQVIKCFTRFDTLHTKIAVPQAALATAMNTRPRAWT